MFRRISNSIVAAIVALLSSILEIDIDLGRLYLSPFHHSPMALYRAYKGEADLPLRIEVDSLFVGHRGQDTLIYVHTLRLGATLRTQGQDSILQRFTQIPIQVDELYLEKTVFHSDSLIASVGIDALVGKLEVSDSHILIAEGKYPLHGLRLNDVDVLIDLRETAPDTTVQDTTPLLLAFDIPDGELRNIHYAMTPLNLDIRTRALSTQALVDVGANIYDAQRLSSYQLEAMKCYEKYAVLAGDTLKYIRNIEMMGIRNVT